MEFSLLHLPFSLTWLKCLKDGSQIWRYTFQEPQGTRTCQVPMRQDREIVCSPLRRSIPNLCSAMIPVSMPHLFLGILLFVRCVHLRLFSVCLVVQMVEFPLFIYMYIFLYRRIAVTTLIEFSSNVELLISWSRCRVIVVVVHNSIGVYISVPYCILQYACVGRPKGGLPPLAGVAVSACYV